MNIYSVLRLSGSQERMLLDTDLGGVYCRNLKLTCKLSYPNSDVTHWFVDHHFEALSWAFQLLPS